MGYTCKAASEPWTCPRGRLCYQQVYIVSAEFLLSLLGRWHQLAVLVRSAPLRSPFRRCCSRIYLPSSKIPLPGASILPSDPPTPVVALHFTVRTWAFFPCWAMGFNKGSKRLVSITSLSWKLVLTHSKLCSATSGFLVSSLSSVPGQLFLPGFPNLVFFFFPECYNGQNCSRTYFLLLFCFVFIVVSSVWFLSTQQRGKRLSIYLFFDSPGLCWFCSASVLFWEGNSIGPGMQEKEYNITAAETCSPAESKVGLTLGRQPWPRYTQRRRCDHWREF